MLTLVSTNSSKYFVFEIFIFGLFPFDISFRPFSFRPSDTVPLETASNGSYRAFGTMRDFSEGALLVEMCVRQKSFLFSCQLNHRNVTGSNRHEHKWRPMRKYGRVQYDVLFEIKLGSFLLCISIACPR
jgi:hypothetical protein